jgi:hypothetical protein
MAIWMASWPRRWRKKSAASHEKKWKTSNSATFLMVARRRASPFRAAEPCEKIEDLE